MTKQDIEYLIEKLTTANEHLDEWHISEYSGDIHFAQRKIQLALNLLTLELKIDKDEN